MNSKTKRRLKIYLPILASIVVVAAIVVAIILLNNRITAKDYFDAINKQNYSKQIQTTQITENNTLIYEKIETIVFDGNNVYHEIKEKQISKDLDKDYDEVITEYYYSKDKLYHFEDGTWKEENFDLSTKLKTYDLKTNYFKTISFNKKFESEGRLEGEIKKDSISKIVNDLNLQEMSVVIVVNKNFNALKFDINAKTSTMRDVTIRNVYSYNNETVVLPTN